MLGRDHRFHGYGSLKFVYQHGQNVRGTVMGVRFAPNPRRRKYRFAVVVSKKVHKSAVVRNRIRRRVFELARQHSAQLPAAHDIVVTVFNDSVATMPASELETKFIQLMTRAELLGPATPRNERDIIETEET